MYTENCEDYLHNEYYYYAYLDEVSSSCAQLKLPQNGPIIVDKQKERERRH